MLIIQGVHFLLSGNHFGSNWSYHGQPHLLHLSCSHLQKDTKERHNCSGYSVLLTDHLLIAYVSLPTLLIRHASFLSVRLGGALGGSLHLAAQHFYHPLNFRQKSRQQSSSTTPSSSRQERSAATRPPRFTW